MINTAPTTLIKSKERVKNKGEVFTPIPVVNKMLDLIPSISIKQTFLEPSCGTGNFVIEILKRKFAISHCEKDYYNSLKSVYGIDIQADNIEETKKNILFTFPQLSQLNTIYINFILNKNYIVGDFLKDEIAFIDWFDGEKIKYINKKQPTLF